MRLLYRGFTSIQWGNPDMLGLVIFLLLMFVGVSGMVGFAHYDNQNQDRMREHQQQLEKQIQKNQHLAEQQAYARQHQFDKMIRQYAKKHHG